MIEKTTFLKEYVTAHYGLTLIYVGLAYKALMLCVQQIEVCKL